MEKESEYTKVYISVPRTFLKQLDGLARKEHQSRRSALIREAVKLYAEWRGLAPRERFFAMTDQLRERFQGVPEAQLEQQIDEAVTRVRRTRRGG